MRIKREGEFEITSDDLLTVWDEEGCNPDLLSLVAILKGIASRVSDESLRKLKEYYPEAWKENEAFLLHFEAMARMAKEKSPPPAASEGQGP